MADVLDRWGPDRATVPLVVDSPHSGRTYPPDFAYTCPLPALRSMEDPCVDELARPADALGAVVLAARFPRTYVDPNRDQADIDVELLSGRWSGPLTPTEQARMGRGVVFRRLPRIMNRIAAPLDIYNRRLTTAEVESRISTYWRPYDTALRNALDDAFAQHGRVIHLDMHSCYPSGLAARDGEGGPNPDVTLTDNGGRSADPRLIRRLGAVIESFGWTVGYNDPFPYGALAARHADPQCGRHGVMVEVNRRRHLNIDTLEASEELPACCEVMIAMYREAIAFANDGR